MDDTQGSFTFADDIVATYGRGRIGNQLETAYKEMKRILIIILKKNCNRVVDRTTNFIGKGQQTLRSRAGGKHNSVVENRRDLPDLSIFGNITH